MFNTWFSSDTILRKKHLTIAPIKKVSETPKFCFFKCNSEEFSNKSKILMCISYQIFFGKTKIAIFRFKIASASKKELCNQGSVVIWLYISYSLFLLDTVVCYIRLFHCHIACNSCVSSNVKFKCLSLDLKQYDVLNPTR